VSLEIHEHKTHLLDIRGKLATEYPSHQCSNIFGCVPGLAVSRFHIPKSKMPPSRSISSSYRLLPTLRLYLLRLLLSISFFTSGVLSITVALIISHLLYGRSQANSLLSRLSSKPCAQDPNHQSSPSDTQQVPSSRPGRVRRRSLIGILWCFRNGIGGRYDFGSTWCETRQW
jgi:hypothetical protein